MSVQARIRAFEATGTGIPQHNVSSPRTSLTFSSDDGLTIASSSAPTSPKASLLDDMDFVLASASSSPRLQSTKPDMPRKTPSKPANSTSPLITFNSPPSPPYKSQLGESAIMVPPLPPRRQPSLMSFASSLDRAPIPSPSPMPPLPPRSHGSSPANVGHVKSSDSLTINHSYPPQLRSSSNASSSRTRHNHASSTSSFISLSLSSDPGDQEHGVIVEDDVFKISSSAAASFPNDVHDASPSLKSIGLGNSPFTAGQKSVIFPQKPPRPSSSSAASIASTSSSNSGLSRGPPSYPSQKPTPPVQAPYPVRRPAPPPPSRPSTLSQRQPSPPSLTSQSSGSFKNQGIHRRTPVPPAARLRYQALFDRNVSRHKAAPTSVSSLLSANDAFNANSNNGLKPSRGRAAGWRGTSIDLVTAKAIDNEAQADRLDGQIVKAIWSCSQLSKKLLSSIWLECDGDKRGTLDREAFVQGMWKIDEELIKLASASNTPKLNANPIGRSGTLTRPYQPTSPLL